MFGKKLVVTAIAGIASIALPAFAQSEDSGKNEVSVQAFGSFVKSTTDNGVQNSATNSGGVLGSYRRFFDAHSGIEVNYGYALNTQNYVSSSSAVGVRSYSHEVSGAYVFRMPLAHFTPFVLAGAGGLVFDPRGVQGADTQTRAAGVMAAEPISGSRGMCSCAPNIAASSTIRQLTALRTWLARIASRTAPSRRSALAIVSKACNGR